MWAVHGSLLINMFSLTASIPQAVASTLGLGLSSDASIEVGEIATQTKDVAHPCIHRDELNRFLDESPVRPKDTMEDIQPRIEITYTPMFTGVQSSFG
jgi:hypothetical protein